tara:strand:- start:249 stop:434 length:186 start_codon:yes stop_codon:yes gene_type:complete
MENFIRVNIFKNLMPELVEKKDPPIITKIKNKKNKFSGTSDGEKPILVILLTNEKNIVEKL